MPRCNVQRATLRISRAEPLRADEEVEAAWEEGLSLLNNRKSDKQARPLCLHHSGHRPSSRRSNASSLTCARKFSSVST